MIGKIKTQIRRFKVSWKEPKRHADAEADMLERFDIWRRDYCPSIISVNFGYNEYEQYVWLDVLFYGYEGEWEDKT